MNDGIDGEWTILAVEYGGEALPGRGGTLQVREGRFALQIGGTPREVGLVECAGSAGADGTLDLIWLEAGLETRRLRAIVRTRGRLMQFCYFPENASARPRHFDSRSQVDSPPAILVRCRQVLDELA